MSWNTAWPLRVSSINRFSAATTSGGCTREWYGISDPMSRNGTSGSAVTLPPGSNKRANPAKAGCCSKSEIRSSTSKCLFMGGELVAPAAVRVDWTPAAAARAAAPNSDRRPTLPLPLEIVRFKSVALRGAVERPSGETPGGRGSRADEVTCERLAMPLTASAVPRRRLRPARPAGGARPGWGWWPRRRSVPSTRRCRS